MSFAATTSRELFPASSRRASGKSASGWLARPDFRRVTRLSGGPSRTVLATNPRPSCANFNALTAITPASPGWWACWTGSSNLFKDPDLTGFRVALGIETRIANGSHIVLVHQTTDDEASERPRASGTRDHRLYLLFAARGSSLPLPAGDSSCLVRRASTDTGHFSRRRMPMFSRLPAVITIPPGTPWSPTTGAAPTARRQFRRASGRQRGIAEFQRWSIGSRPRAKLRVTLSGESAKHFGQPEAMALIDSLEREVRREELLLDLERRAIDEGTAAHEMSTCWPPTAACLPRHDAFPIWLQEGLAMQFEVVRGGRWAGIGRAHDLRLPDWRQIQPPPRLSSPWSATSAMARVTSAIPTLRHGRWFITSAPAIRRSS